MIAPRLRTLSNNPACNKRTLSALGFRSHFPSPVFAARHDTHLPTPSTHIYPPLSTGGRCRLLRHRERHVRARAGAANAAINNERTNEPSQSLLLLGEDRCRHSRETYCGDASPVASGVCLSPSLSDGDGYAQVRLEVTDTGELVIEDISGVRAWPRIAAAG